jgi:amino acid adenylation domain-containing protein
MSQQLISSGFLIPCGRGMSKKTMSKKNLFQYSPIQETYIHGRNHAFGLGGRAAFVYFEIAFDHQISKEQLSKAWGSAHSHIPELSIVPGLTGYHLNESAKNPLKLTSLNSAEEMQNLRKRLKQERININEFRAVDGTLVHQTSLGWRLCLRFDLLTFDATSIKNFIEILHNEYLGNAPEAKKCLPPCVEIPLKEAKASVPADLLNLVTSPSLPATGINKPKIWQNKEFELEPIHLTKLKSVAKGLGLSTEALLSLSLCEVMSHWSEAKDFAIPTLKPKTDPLTKIQNSCRLDIVPYRRDTKSIKERWLHSQVVQEKLKPFCGHNILREKSRAKGGQDGSSIPYAMSINLGPSCDFWTAVTQWHATIEEFSIETPFVLLDFQMFESGNSLMVRSEYFADAFGPTIIEGIMERFQSFLKELADNPSLVETTGIDPLPKTQRDLRNKINRPSTKTLSNELMHDGFFQNAKKHPERVAIFSSEKTLTYGELLEHVKHLSDELLANGPIQGQLVAIKLEKNWLQVAATLAILKNGAAYLPICPKLPEERISYLLDVCDVGCVVEKGGIRFIKTCDQAQNQETRAAKPSDLAYVIFTSGSTGLPKGVMIDHQSALNTIVDINEKFSISQDDVAIAISNLNFDLSVFDIFGLLRAGGAIAIPDPERNNDPRQWLEMCHGFGVTLWNSVPAIFELAIGRLERFGDPYPESLRLVMMSGDWIPTDLAQRTWDICASVDLISLGGATEGSIWSIYHRIEKSDLDRPSIPYGKPLTNQWFAVRDENFDDCPVGVPGEIIIGGQGVALGYWKDEERTKKSFVDGIYRTGDLGCYRPDGSIEFQGRRDNQVKVNGYRVELGEIESALAQVEAVSAAVVNCSGNRFGKKSLHAFVVPEENTDPMDLAKIKEDLRALVPPYMVPNSIHLIAKIPLSANGKVDRKQLPAIDLDQSDSKSVPSNSPIQEKILQTYRKVLGPVKMDESSDFFALGGDSLGAIELLSCMEEEFGVAVSMADFVAAKSPRNLEKLLGNTKAEAQSFTEFSAASTGPTIVLFYPVGGQLACYRNLIDRLKDSYHLVGFSAPALSNNETINQLAKQYAEALLSAGMRPALHLGWSFGGFLANATSQMVLAQSSLSVPAYLIDSIPCLGRQEDWTEAKLIRSFLIDLTENGTLGQLPTMKDMGGLGLSGILGKIKSNGGSQSSPLALPVEKLQRHFECYKSNMMALARYRQPKSEHPIILAYTKESKVFALSYWASPDRQVKSMELEGGHFDVFRGNNLGVITNTIEDLLNSSEELNYGAK